MSKAIKWRELAPGVGDFRHFTADVVDGFRLECYQEWTDSNKPWKILLRADTSQRYDDTFDHLRDAKKFAIHEAEAFLRDMIICASDALRVLGLDVEDDQ